MLYVNREVVESKYFPDNTQLLKITTSNKHVTICWKYQCDEELVTLYFITKHLQSLGVHVELLMYYIPNARFDRTKNTSEVFTLKYFTEVINSLQFVSVTVLDPHSNVSTALINNVVALSPMYYIRDVISSIGSPILCYPDEGAMKRYNSDFNSPYVYCTKERNWKNGEILSLTLHGNTDLIKGANILIVDDICSKGGTFLYTAKELKKYEPASISLFITHCEDTIADGELINSGLLSHIYTTDSILTLKHSLISVTKLPLQLTFTS